MSAPVTPGAVEVRPEDREAYLQLNNLPEKYADAVRAGEWDQVMGIQILARHRIAATPPDALQTVVEAWQPIESAPKDGKSGSFLVTNNIKARNAYGHMSHLWLVDLVHENGGEYVAFTEGFRKIEGLSHWMPLPKPPALSLAGGDV